MDLKIYRYFHQIAKLGTLRKASEKLHIAPSALSRHIKSLEEHHNVILFCRSSKGMELTAVGEIVYQYSERLFNQHRILLNQINDLTSVGQGSISYCAIEGVLSSIILPAVTEFQKNFPCISFHGSIESTDSAYKLVSEGVIDFGIAFEGDYHNDIENIAEFYSDIIIVTDSENSFLKTNIIHFEELAKHPVATLSDSFYTRQILHKIELNEKISLNINMEADQIDFLKRFILKKEYIGIFPEFAVIDELEAGKLRKISYENNDLCNIKTVVIQKKCRFQSNATRMFLDYLINQIKNKLLS